MAENNTSLRSDLVSTTAAAVVTTAANVLLYKLAATWLGDSGFALYAVGRRVLSVLLPLTLIGVGVALPRYIARTAPGDDRRLLVVRALQAMAATNIIAISTCYLMREQISTLMFGGAEHAAVVVSVAVSTAGGSLYAISYGHLRGSLQIRAANLFSVAGIGIVPVVSIILANGSVQSVFVLHGVLLSAISVPLLASVLSKGFTAAGESDAPSEMVAYGLRRVPGDFALMGLIAAPSLVAVSEYGLEVGGMVAFGTTLTTLFGTALSPVSTLLLPYFAKASGSNGELRSLTEGVFSKIVPALAVGVIGCGVFALLSRSIIFAYLGPQYAELSYIPGVMIWSGLGYGVYVMLRSVNDAMEFRAINARATLLSLIAFLLSCIIVHLKVYNVRVMLVAFILAMAGLGVSTWKSARDVTERSL